MAKGTGTEKPLYVVRTSFIQEPSLTGQDGQEELWFPAKMQPDTGTLPPPPTVMNRPGPGL